MTRINYTGRRRIPREAVTLRVRNSSAGPVLDVLSLGVHAVTVPTDAIVVVEAYRQTAYMRFAAGTVASPKLLTEEALHEFDSAESMRFRIKVVGTGLHEGKILAQADQIRPVIEDSITPPQSSLLVIVPKPLGQTLWRLDIIDDEPELAVNSQLGDWKTFASSPIFSALVLPETLRQIAKWVIKDLSSLDEDDETNLSKWVKYFSDAGYDPRDLEDSEQVRMQWVEDIVTSFASKHRFRELIRDHTGELEE